MNDTELKAYIRKYIKDNVPDLDDDKQAFEMGWKLSLDLGKQGISSQRMAHAFLEIIAEDEPVTYIHLSPKDLGKFIQ